MATSSEITAAIDALRVKTETNSVTPADVAAVMDLIASQAQSASDYVDSFAATFNAHVSDYNAHIDYFNQLKAAKFMLQSVYCDASGFILYSKLPQKLLLYDDPAIRSKLPSDIVYSSSQVGASQILPQLFDKAVNANQKIYKHGSQTYSEVEQKSQTSTGTEMRANGYYPNVSGHEYAPYYAFGVWMTDMQALAMLYDRYSPFDGGTMCQSAVNFPSQPKSTDTMLRLDYAVCNNHRQKAMVLGTGGWADSVCPLSVHRAFHGAQELRAVIGEIDLRYLAAAPAIFISNCPELWQFHLANIPDCIELLDLSECSADIKSTHRYDTGSGTFLTSTLSYLAANYKRDITRTKDLTIKVPSAAYNAAVSAFAGKSDVTIVEI